MGRYIFNVLVALDLLLAAFCGCKRNETLSAAAYSLEKDGKWMGRVWRPVIDLALSWREYEHCRRQWELEQRWNRSFNEQ